MNTADEHLDAALAAMRDELNRQAAPAEVPDALRQAVAGKKSGAAWRWLLSSAAAVALLAVTAVWLQVLPDGTSTETQAAVGGLQPERFMVRRQQVPVRVVSPYTGASFRLVDASIVTDQRGLARAVYLHASSTNQEIQ